jgi:polyphosphate kinase
VDLQVRGICCLCPGIPCVSENINVSTIVGRFLEHARVYYFHNSGNEEIFLGSADLMPRNLDRRVEVLFPIEDPVIRQAIVAKILAAQLQDTVKLRTMQADGTYCRFPPVPAAEPVNVQTWMVDHRGTWYDRTT